MKPTTRLHLVYAAIIVGLLVAGTLAAHAAWKWYTVTAPELKRELGVAHTAAAAQQALAKTWQVRARALEATVLVDTARMRDLLAVHHVELGYALTGEPGSPSVSAPAVPMPSDPVIWGDSLGAACTRLAHDCTQALAAKDSALAHRDSATAAITASLAIVTRQRNAAERSSMLKQIVWGVVGAAAGRLSCKP